MNTNDLNTALYEKMAAEQDKFRDWLKSQPPEEKMCIRDRAFLSQNRDCFAIYQVSRDDPQNVRFMNLDWLKSHDISIDRSNCLLYTSRCV